MKKLSIKEYQARLEEIVKQGGLPSPSKFSRSVVKETFDAYKTIENKQAKLAVLHQLAYILWESQLRNNTKRFEEILEKAGIEKSFAYDLINAYTNKKEKEKNG